MYACVEAAKDWISSGSWQDCGRVPESIPSAKASDSATGNAPRAGVKGAVLKPVLTLEESCLHLSVFAEESEEQADWMVAQATREAAVVAAALRYQSDSSIKLDDIIDLIDVTGLQGKIRPTY